MLRQRRRASLGSLIGITIEWYEDYIYGAIAALDFPHLFCAYAALSTLRAELGPAPGLAQ